VIEEDNLKSNAQLVGGYLRQRLAELQEKHRLIGDVRGMGLLQAMELVNDRQSKDPAPQATNAFMDECRQRGLLVGKGGFYANVIRLSPPLNITKSDVEEAVAKMDAAFTAVEGRQ
jgi:4-aminobutyrate aminotransferase-like enzyme